jgi:hypothetical protein
MSALHDWNIDVALFCMLVCVRLFLEKMFFFNSPFVMWHN